jgi:hypothetical protein
LPRCATALEPALPSRMSIGVAEQATPGATMKINYK